MCMHEVFSPKRRQEYIDKIPKGEGIKVYRVMKKVVSRVSRYGSIPPRQRDDFSFVTLYKSVYANYGFKLGVNKTGIIQSIGMTSDQQYLAGFHSFLTREDAELYQATMPQKNETIIIECTVKKSWVTDVGLQHEYWGNYELDCIISKKIRIDKFPEE